MARSASRAEPSATVETAWLLAGFRISRVPPSAAGFHSPLMKRLAVLMSWTSAEFSNFVRPTRWAVAPGASHPFHFAFLDKNLQTLATEVLHQRLGIQRFGHHDTAFF